MPNLEARVICTIFDYDMTMMPAAWLLHRQPTLLAHLTWHASLSHPPVKLDTRNSHLIWASGPVLCLTYHPPSTRLTGSAEARQA